MKIFFALLISVCVFTSECAVWRSAPRFPRNPDSAKAKPNVAAEEIGGTADAVFNGREWVAVEDLPPVREYPASGSSGTAQFSWSRAVIWRVFECIFLLNTLCVCL